MTVRNICDYTLLPKELAGIIVDYAGTRERSQYPYIEPSTSNVFRNSILHLVTWGGSTYKATQCYQQALKNKKWEDAEQAILNGARVSHSIGWYNQLSKRNKPAASFALTQAGPDAYWKFHRDVIKRLPLHSGKGKRLFGVWAGGLNAHVGDLNRFENPFWILKEAIDFNDFEAAQSVLQIIYKQISPDITKLRNSIGEHKAFQFIQFHSPRGIVHLKFWIENGLPVDTVQGEDRNMSLLWFSIRAQNRACVQYLLENGASLQITAEMSPCDGTPLEVAKRVGNPEIIQLIEDRIQRDRQQIQSKELFECKEREGR